MEFLNTLHKPKILMVDDKPENLLALERLLIDFPVILYKAENGNDALKLSLHHEFALALLDIQMPEMDGYELAELLRQEVKTEDLPFIFISAIYTENINVFQGYEKGAFSYVTKPFEPEVLLNKIRFFIKKYQQEQLLIEQQEQLKRTNEELESFSYSVSHDLRAPLRAVSGYSSLLLQNHKNQLDEEGQKFLNIINKEAGRMGQLIDDLLDFSQMNRLKVNDTDAISMDALILECRDEVRKMYPGVSPRFFINPLPKVKANRALLHQVFVNLLGNAVKYRKPDQVPVIKIEARTDEVNQQYIFSIKDNGVGFDMKYADKLFGVFQRLHSNEEFEGNGIGLALVRRIVNRHGGETWAESEPRVGSTFYFSLPAVIKQQELVN